MATARERVWAVGGLALAALVAGATGISSRNGHSDAHLELEGRLALDAMNGIVLLYSPSCEISARVATALDYWGATPGVSVRVVTVLPPDEALDLEGDLQKAGLLIPHAVASEAMMEAITNLGLRMPAALVFRHGRLAGAFSDSGLEKLHDLLPILFGATPQPVVPS